MYISTNEPSCAGPASRVKLRFGYPLTSAVLGLIFRALSFPLQDRVLFLYFIPVIFTVLFEKFKIKNNCASAFGRLKDG